MYNGSYEGGAHHVPPTGSAHDTYEPSVPSYHPPVPSYQPPITSYQPTSESYGYNQQQQHQTSPSVVVVVNQPTDPRSVAEPLRTWSSGLCGCCDDCESCCYAYWCYPCFLCTLSQDMGEYCCGPCCCGAGCGYSSFPNPFLVGMRARFRTKYGIRGGICDDTCRTWCCECCVVMQMARELKHSGNKFR